MKQDNTTGLTQLGSSKTEYIYDTPRRDILETFPNPHPDRDYVVTHITNEWGSLCPKTGQPDTGVVTVEMTPDKKCVESKSLKLYFFAHRNHGAFMENIVGSILNDLVAVCDPRWCRVTGAFGVRGGIQTTVVVEHRK